MKTMAAATRWYFAVILFIMRRLADRFIHLGAALAVGLSSSLAQADGATVSLATNGRDTAQLICNGSVILHEVYYLRLTLSDGALLISWRESLRGGAPDRVLILTDFGQCHAQETGVPFFGAGRFNSY
jgi:hypothetical protein